MVNDEQGTLVTCNEARTACWTPCEVKMREAMREVDRYLKMGIVSISERWHQTMRECVAEKTPK